MPSILALNAEIGREYGMASMMGFVDAAMGFGMLFGSLTSGLVMDAVGIKGVFYYGIIIGLIGLSVFAVVTKEQRRAQDGILNASEIP
jgi:predicted MFS family arabinose efflux permease